MARFAKTFRESIRSRAESRCEYCRLPDWAAISPFHIEHVIPLKHRGSSDLDNLAWACVECNVAKGSDLAAYDENTGELTPLFHPRTQKWDDHFLSHDNGIIEGKTAVGRATVDLLRMNDEDQVRLRRVIFRRARK